MYAEPAAKKVISCARLFDVADVLHNNIDKIVLWKMMYNASRVHGCSMS